MLKMFLLWRCCYVEDAVTMRMLKMLKMLLRWRCWRCWRCCDIEGVAMLKMLLPFDAKTNWEDSTNFAQKDSGSYGCSRFAQETWSGDCDECPCTISQGSHEWGAKHGTSRLNWLQEAWRKKKREEHVRWQDDLQSFRLEFWRSAEPTVLGVYIYNIYIYVCVLLLYISMVVYIYIHIYR